MMVLITLTILSLLGISLMSLATVSYRLMKTDSRVKSAQYLAESGLDQAFEIMSNEVKDAIELAKGKVFTGDLEPEDIPDGVVLKIGEDWVDEELEDMDRVELFIYCQRELEKLGTEDSPYLEGEDGTGAIIESELDEKINEWFQEAYRKDMDNGSMTTKLTDSVPGETYYRNLHDSGQKPVITILSSTPFGGGDTYSIRLSSNYIFEGVPRTLETTFSINVPDYNQRYTVENITESYLVKNTLFSKALLAEKNIYVLGNDVTINGDVYAYGEDDAASNKGILAGNGPINVGGSINVNSNTSAANELNLTINGKVITGGDIKTNDDYSNITINGDTYCENMTIPPTTVENRIAVGQDESPGYVHTLEALRLEGDNAEIDIKGKYFGFSAGVDEDVNRSRIVINSLDLGAGPADSSISISGESKSVEDKFPTTQTDPAVYSKPSGSVIAGTSFVGLSPIDGEKVFYQTGESISYIDNYTAYSKHLRASDQPSGPFPTGEPGYEPEYEESNIIWGALSDIHDIALGFISNDLDNSGPTQYFSDAYDEHGNSLPYSEYEDDAGDDYRLYKGLPYKRNYFIYAYRQDLFKHDNGIHFEGLEGIKNIAYSAGAYIDEGVVKHQKNDDSIINLLSKFENEFKYYVNKIADPQIPNYLNTSQNLDTVTRVGDFFDFTGTVTNIFDSKEIYYKNSDPSKRLEIIGPGASALGLSNCDSRQISTSANTNYGEDNPLKGIIVTKGDVFISGEVYFKGTIITSGNIYIIDNNPKIITNDYDESTTAKNFIVKRVYDDIRTPAQQIGDLFSQTGTIMLNLSTSKVERIVDSSSYINFQEIIKISNWKRGS